MTKIPGWSLVDKDREKWKQYNRSLGNATYDGGVEVVVWECDNADIDYVVFKDPHTGTYHASLNGSDQTKPPVNIKTRADVFGIGETAITTKEEARKAAAEELRRHPNPLGVLGMENKYRVHEVSVGKYHTQGMGATKYASSEASDLAENLEKEFNVETAIGSVEGRTSRSFAKGGNYGGKIPVYATADIPEEVVRKVKRKYNSFDDFDGEINWRAR